MFKKLLHFRAAFMLLSSMLLAVAGYSQGVTTSSISGVVTDDKGQPLPGATVVAIHTPSGTRYGITTNSAGRYNFPAVRIGGPYDITITFVGYQETKRQLLSADLGVPASLNIQLTEEGKQLSEVVVTARGSIIDSERSGASTNFKKETFERLPTLNRSFQDFSQLTPQAGPGFAFGGRSNLYNNFSIDGATSNNVFGLSALPGGQSNAQPVSVDAIQEISVQLSPYDVSQGAFTGAGVNAVTRSGTNKLQGSAYYFTKNDKLTGQKIAGTELPELQRPAFSYANYGARLGGAIIKNKLFFFGNIEREEATSPGVLYPYGQSTNGIANQPGSVLQGSSTVNPETDLERLRNFLINTGTNKTWTYDPGTYGNFNVPQQSTKFLVKVDWNINDNNKLTVRYNQLNAFRDVAPSGSGGFLSGPTGGRSNSNNTLPFSNSYYRILNNLYSVFGELNSSFGQGKFANNLQLGYNSFRDTRQQGGGGTVTQFPTVDILGPNGQNLTSFGPDPFTPNNRLDQDVIQVNDKFDAFLGDHTVTVGTANEFYHFYNVFTQVVNGIYQFNSISDFINNVTSPSSSNLPSRFYQQYSALAGNPAPAADFRAAQIGFYAQDAYNGIKNLRLTLGVRVDVPIYNQTGLYRNEAVENLSFVNGDKLYVDRLPVTTPLWSPRVGFNWDVLGNKSLQIRGGAGIFTGRVPFVWISNQLSNNGVFFNTLNAVATSTTNPLTLASGQPNYNNINNIRFNPDINAYVPTSLSAASSFALNVTSPNFKFPQVFRANIGVDKVLPGGFVLTGEAIYTKDVNAVYIRDANLRAPVGTLSGDGRPLYGTNLLINSNVTQALVQDNTNQGYAFSLTGQLQKTTGKLQGSIAYTFTDSKDLNAQGGSTAGSLFTSNPYVTDINSPVLGYASNWFPHRVIGNINYRFDYAKFFATTLSLIYEGRNGGNFSYVYSGAPNGLTSAANTNLLYIPRNQSEILLTTTNASDTRTSQQIWDQLNNYIEQDPYLKARRGQYAERGAALTPWVDFLNFRLLQDFKLAVGQNVNTLQLSFEMFNVLNFFNSNLGVVKTAARTSLIGFSGYETANSATAPGTTGRPIYTFATNADGTPLSSSYLNSQSVSNGVTTSRWQAQLGVRYIFN